MGDGTGATAADRSSTDGEADRDDTVRREDIPDDGDVLGSGLVVDSDGWVIGRIADQGSGG